MEIVSVIIAALAFSSTTTPFPIPGEKIPLTAPLKNSFALRKFSWKSFVPVLPLGGRSRLDPSMNSGASDFTCASGTTFRNLSPIADTPTWFSVSRVSSARTSSDFGIGRSIFRE